MRYEVLGIGAPLLDHILHVPNEFIERLQGPKEGMELITQRELTQLLADSQAKDVQVPGGSTINTLRGLSRLDIPCAFIGSVGKDKKGLLIKQELTKHHIESLLHDSVMPTGEVLCFVTPDGKRTFRTFYGASTDLKHDLLKQEHFDNLKIVHMEGYTMVNDMEICHQALKFSKRAKVKFSFDLSNFEVVRNNKHLYMDLIKYKPDILFGNFDELQELTGLEVEEACKKLTEYATLVVGLMGAKGCCIAIAGKAAFYPAYPKVPLDTTGAGDLFISGFLFGLLRGKPMAICAHYGALLGGAVVQYEGAEIPGVAWSELRKEILS